MAQNEEEESKFDDNAKGEGVIVFHSPQRRRRQNRREKEIDDLDKLIDMQVSEQKASKGSRGDKSTRKGEDSAAPAFTIKPVEMHRDRN